MTLPNWMLYTGLIVLVFVALSLDNPCDRNTGGYAACMEAYND